jgi:hypothetical protein
MLNLIRLQLALHGRSHSLYVTFSLLFVIYNVLLVFMGDLSKHTNIVLSLFATFAAMMNVVFQIGKHDFYDGTIENLVVSSSPIKIVLSKFISLSLILTSCFLCISPLFLIIYRLHYYEFLIWIFNSSLLIIFMSNLAVMINIVNYYLSSSSRILMAFLLLLAMPFMILSASYWSTHNANLLLTLLGAVIIMIPITTLASSYLIENLF